MTYRVRDSVGNRTQQTVNFTVRPDTDPFFIDLTDQVVPVQGTFNPLFGVSASDLEDGDLTSSITVTGNTDTSVPGPQTITYSVTDSDGNTVSETITVTVVVDVPPTILNANDITFFQGDGAAFFLALGSVSAEDFLGNNISFNLSFSGITTIDDPGTFTLTYTVSDAFDNVASVDVTLTILADLAPTISGVQDITMWQGDSGDFFDGVSALDDKDGDLTHLLGLSTTPVFDPDMSGVYDVVYMVQDSFGNVTTQAAIFTVVADLPPVLTGVVTNRTVEVGESIDLLQGVSASDDKDGDITLNIQVIGTVDTDTIDTYSIVYSVTDSFGNVATQGAIISVEAAAAGTIMDELRKNAELSIFVEALEAGNLDSLLESTSITYTVFAPNNDAFNEFFYDSNIEKQDFFNSLILEDFLLNHIVEGGYNYLGLEDIVNGLDSTPDTLLGVPLDISLVSSFISVNGLAFLDDRPHVI